MWQGVLTYGAEGGRWGGSNNPVLIAALADHMRHPSDVGKREHYDKLKAQNDKVHDAKSAAGRWGGPNNPALLIARVEHELDPTDQVKRERYEQVKAQNDAVSRSKSLNATRLNKAAKEVEQARREAAPAKKQIAMASFEAQRELKMREAAEKKK